jgi:hypothetical protein
MAAAAEIQRLAEAAPFVDAIVSPFSPSGFAMIYGAEESERTYNLFTPGDLPMVIKAHWPAKNQELWSTRPDDVIEDFTIVYNGFSFAVLAQLQRLLSPRYAYTFGREARRILSAMLQPSAMWAAEVIGPCPMFPSPYLVFSDSDDPRLNRELLEDGNSLENVLRVPTTSDPLKRAVQIATASLHSADTLYWLSAQDQDFHDARDKVYETFAACSAIYAAGFTGRAGIRKPRLRQALSSVYSAFVRAEELRHRLTNQSESVRSMFERDFLLASHSEYPLEYAAAARTWHNEHLVEALRYMAEEARSQGLGRATIVASLIGGLLALAGTTVALLLTR